MAYCRLIVIAGLGAGQANHRFKSCFRATLNTEEREQMSQIVEKPVSYYIIIMKNSNVARLKILWKRVGPIRVKHEHILEISAIPNYARLQPRRQLSEARILLYVQLFYQIRQLHVLLPQFQAGFLASYSAPSRRLSDFLAECGRL